MNMKLHGFLIGSDIQVDIDNKRLIRISSENSYKILNLSAVVLKDTVMKLLIFLLTHASDHIVSNEEILQKVWEENNLSSSNQRLWQVVTELKEKLSLIGMPQDFIINRRGEGYKINSTRITPLYYKQ
ncbi:winged helix-turn-helix domain-containing protein [Pragia fontium]|uniref:Transcriptional regulatory protein, C terminal n=1 Tax=Pragia fontium DSM 5563 = ATCC 49100 TaxID=1122977 RepID=A0AAJ4WDG2_9GAMM|nr:helix-turn-helix domain-containing protein [Pragia fontium]SFD41639.1 Transcriptional regulatory protein, C terminal [Pragia fontium DSM 5563 = ATCC 49100]VEJ55489.1 Transcriptional regulatory protein, C terminal [Pragia fontium]